MNLLLRLKVDVRLLAVLLMTMAVVWWYSLWLGLQAEGFLSDLNLFWGVFFFSFLYGGPLLAFGLFLIHVEESRKHPFYVYPAIGIAVSPWLPAALWFVLTA